MKDSQPKESEPPHARLQLALNIARCASIFAVVVGIVALLGWTFDIPLAKQGVTGGVAIAPATALAFVLIGVAVALLAFDKFPRLAQALAAGGGILGILRLADVVFALKLNLDRLWYGEIDARMAPATALALILLGTATLVARSRRFANTFQYAAILSSLIGWLGFIHYLYGGVMLLPFGEMAIHTALTLVALSVGVLCCRADRGLLALLVSDSAGGLLIRRLAPAAVMVPTMFGWFRLEGQRAGWYGPEAGIAIFALGNVVIFSGLIWKLGKLLHAMDQRFRSEVREKVQEYTTELREANDDLEAFSYSVSHDLRAPVRSIRVFAQILQQDHPEERSTETRRITHNIAKSAEFMERLIVDLLRFSRLGHQPIEKRLVPGETIVRRALAELRGAPGDRANITVRVHDLPDLLCDDALIQQVFVNLLSNAFKFTGYREDAVVEIRGELRDGLAMVCVRDNGVGFDMQQANRLFEVFQRLPGTADYEGNGIGLSIVSRIIQRHGGRVWAEAEPDRGAEFYFTLPA